MKTKILIALSTVAFLSACGSKSDDSGNTKLSIPDSIDEKITVGPELTVDEKSKLKFFFEKQSSLKILEDIYSKKDEYAADAQARKQRLENAAPKEKELIDEIQKNCTIQNPIEEERPLEGEPRAGSTEQANGSSSMSGEKCPIDKRAAWDKILKVVSYTPSANTGELTVTANEIDSTKVVSQKWTEKLGLIERGTKIETNWAARQLENSRSFHMKRKISGYYKHIGSSLSMTGAAEATDRRSADENGKMATVLRIQFKTEGLQAELSWIQKREGSDKENRYFLNGHSIEESEFRDLFGETFDGMLFPYWSGGQ